MWSLLVPLWALVALGGGASFTPNKELTLVISGAVLCCISDGYIFGQMSGMVDTLLSKDSDIPLSESTVSIIAATINATCVCGFALAAFISEQYGRRRSVTILTFPIIAVWVMLYYARSVEVFMLSRVLVGVCFGGILFLVIVILGEYTPPNMRGFSLNMTTGAANAFGTMLGHVLSIFFHWRTVALLGIIPASLSALLPFFWVESPSWLASKGKFKECEESFRSLHGHRVEAEKELQLLIETEKYKLSRTVGMVQPSIFAMKKLKTAVTQNYFWKLVQITTVVAVYRVAGSKILFSTYAITMLQEMTGSSDILMFTLLVDGFTVLGGCMSCFFISKMKMRTLLFSSAITANVFLLALSASLYFQPANEVFKWMPWINCSLLAMYFITVNAGPYPVLEALYGELYPQEIKGGCIFIFGTVAGIMYYISIRYGTDLFALMGYHGVFLMDTVIMSLCLVYFWIRLPETKGRTLQEIEFYLKNGSFDKVGDFMSGERTKVLI